MRLDVDAIRARWDNSHDRGAHDYTDEGCRVLAEAAFRDVPALLAEMDWLHDGIRAAVDDPANSEHLLRDQLRALLDERRTA